MMEYKLRTEGINGLTIKKRKPQEITIEPLLPEVTEGENDLRYYTVSGLIQPMEDYWISGEGRPPIAIREVQTAVPGMKKYALLEQPFPNLDKVKSKPKRNKKSGKKARVSGINEIVTYSVRYVYSEGIDFKRMVEDEIYATAVISLLQEERLKQKQTQSQQLNSDVVYIGTIAKAEEGYIKAGIRNYTTAVTIIDSDMKKRQEKVDEKIRSKQNARKREEKAKERRSFTATYDNEDWKEMMKEMISRCGIPETAEILRQALEEINNPEQTTPVEPSTDEEEWEW